MNFRCRWLLQLSFLSVLSWGCADGQKPEEAPQEPKQVQQSVDPNTFPEIVATVNGKHIMRADLVARARSAAAHGPDQPLTVAFYRGVLEDLVNSELLYQESLSKGFVPSDEELDERIAAIRGRFPSAEAFEKTLESQGLTEEGMEAALRKDLGVGRMLEDEIISKVGVNESQAREFFKSNADKMNRGDEIRVSHILIRVDRGASAEAEAEAKRRAEQLRERAAAGENFEKLARENSQDPGSAPSGGDLSWIGRGATVASFEQAAYALNKGELSPVVRSPFGFHVIKLQDRRPGKPLTFDEAKDEIAKFLQERAVQERIGARVAELRSKAAVEIFI